MPRIKINKVISFSSEDPIHKATNILSSDPSKKWKCKSRGETSCNVILQFDQPYIITAIDIGNEHSAYIEVQVNRQSCNDDFKTFLVMSSFMTPLESRQSQNINTVRMFSVNDFSKPECEQKWDRMKIVCSQPFNKFVQYGLSFITVHVKEDNSVNVNTAKNIGKFTLRPDSPNNISIGSLFARRKEPLTGAAAIRAASSDPTTIPKSPLLQKLKESKAKIPKLSDTAPNKDKNRDDVLYTDDDNKPHDKIDKLIEGRNREVEKRKADVSEEEVKKPKKKRLSDHVIKNSKTEASTSAGEAKESPQKRKAEQIESPSKKIKVTENKKPLSKPFDKLLEGVVFVISGIANPERSNLRSAALEMGAKYKPNWDSHCTHLICAFMNTPKFNEVKGKGKIVKAKWITECSKKRKRLPWRRYALDPVDKNAAESEEEICETKPEPEIEYMEVDDDLEDEIERIQKLNENKENNKANDYSEDLPEFFKNKYFMLDEELSDSIKKQVRRYITAYSGILSDDLNDSLNYIITATETASKFLDNAGCEMVTADWIWECHNHQKLMPIADFKLY